MKEECLEGKLEMNVSVLKGISKIWQMVFVENVNLLVWLVLLN